MPPDSNGDVALVPGGAGGVGKAVAKALLREGYRPVLLGRDEASLRGAQQILGDGAQHVVADVRDRAAVERAVAWVTETVGPPLVLVNAAGMAESAPLLPPDDALWERTLGVNATGAWIVATACLPAMRAAGRGTICHIASTAALQGYRYTAAYVASKHALLGLTRALAADLQGTAIRVNAICPGFLDTPMTDRTVANMALTTDMTPEQAREELAQMNTSARLIRPVEVAEVVLELLRDDKRSGAAIRLD